MMSLHFFFFIEKLKYADMWSLWYPELIKEEKEVED